MVKRIIVLTIEVDLTNARVSASDVLEETVSNLQFEGYSIVKAGVVIKLNDPPKESSK